MAIQFNCPYCTSAIRVPDSAAGKQGTCPRCGTKLLVPRVPIAGSATEGVSTPGPESHAGPPAAPSPVAFSGAAPVPATEPQPVFPTAGPAGDGPFPSVGQAFPAGAVESRPQPSGDDWPVPAENTASRTLTVRAGKRRRRQARKKALWIVPLASGLVLLGTIGYLVWSRPPALEGELPAKALPSDAGILSKSVSPELGSVSEEVTKPVLDALESHTQALVSQFIRVELRGSRKGLQVSVVSTNQTEFVAVDVRADPTLRTYFDEHETWLDGLRKKELAESLQAFFKGFDPESRDRPIENLTSYRDRLALPALVQGPGYAAEAVVDGVAFRCVFEDKSGKLYFLLPLGTRQFTLQGRQLHDGSTPFPGHYRVKVESDKEPDAKPAEIKKPSGPASGSKPGSKPARGERGGEPEETSR